MKHFLVYTALRIGLFLACYFVVWSLAAAIFGRDSDVLIWSLVGAAVLSSVLSLKLLAGPRERFAQSVQARASRASDAFERSRTKEDAD